MLFLLLSCLSAPPADAADVAPYDQLMQAIRADGDAAWQRLAVLCDSFGPRPTGSAALEQAVAWTAAGMQADGLIATTEPVPVKTWVRGEERLTVLAPYPRELALLGLGGTVGTPGLEAEVVVVGSFDELGPHVKGKIVAYNFPMPDLDPAIDGYGTAVAYRGRGAVAAAEHGAVGVLVRSVTTRSLYTPHTGAMGYRGAKEKIPAAAITTEDAAWMARLQARGTPIRVRLELGAATGPDAVSHNVLGELRGGDLSKEIVLIGAHLDSWDVGQGAHDDGAGVIEVMEAMRHMRALGVTPRRTIRAVLFTNEEHGLAGGAAYDQAHGKEPHAVAMETDLGGGRPEGWVAKGSPAQLAWLSGVLAPTGLKIVDEGGGADIGPLGERGILLAGLLPDDSHYFDVHHTHADTVDKVDPEALREGVAAVAGFAWLAANAP